MAKAGKFVLTVGDEGGILTYFQDMKVMQRLYAPTANYTDTRAFLEAFEADKKAPIYMLVDMMDQSYVQQSLPPVSSLSVNKLIKRKMERDFAAEDLKGALLIGREKSGRRDWKYLFVTVSNSPQLESWIDMLVELPNHFVGVFPLPVEAENFIHRLREAVTGRKFKPVKKKDVVEENIPKWQLLVAHNKVGGFRQVVLKEGKLVFARLAQPIGDMQPDVVAGSIEQEISVTVEYLKRLGYNDEQGMEAYIITSDAIKDSISPANIHLSNVSVFSPHQAAIKLGFENVTQPNDQFADGVMSAVFAAQKKHPLRMETKQSERLNKVYSALMAVKVGGAIATLAALGALGYYGVSIPLTSSKISDEESRLRNSRLQLEELQEKEKELPADLETITDLVSMHHLLNKKLASPLDALQNYARTTNGAKVLLSKFTWSVDSKLTEKGSNNNSGGDEQQGNKVVVGLDIEFFETQRGTDGFNAFLDTYTELLKAAFPGFTVALVNHKPGVSEEQSRNITLAVEDRDPLKDQASIVMSYQLTGTDAIAPADGSSTPEQEYEP
ncbi:MAG: hypothetical protein FJX23_00885 [Alphaproteobacteria bacterium]|nr:hypothetical protein [Alphaproteobacteria bacterium]